MTSPTFDETREIARILMQERGEDDSIHLYYPLAVTIIQSVRQMEEGNLCSKYRSCANYSALEEELNELIRNCLYNDVTSIREFIATHFQKECERWIDKK